jgi:uncharacterized protein YeaO (DUF488 family)
LRRPLRGVPKSDFARLDDYYVWFANLSPTAESVKKAHAMRADARWAVFRRQFRSVLRELLADRCADLD